jgi:hypothetical protein
VETVKTLKDGTVVTAVTSYVYVERNGVPVKVGSVMVIDSKAPGLIEGVDPETPVYRTWDDIPAISRREYERLKAQGLAQPAAGVVLGNPADLSYRETVTTVYKGIEINGAPDSLFGIQGGE